MDLHRAELPSSLLSAVYAAATNPRMWQDVCDALTKHTTVPVMMFGHNLKTDESLGIIAAGIDPAELERYHQHFADLNPWMHMNLAIPVGTVGLSDVALERSELFRTEFYNDWLRHQEDVVAGPAMICHRSKDRLVAMAAACRARGVDDTLPDSHGTFVALAPHLSRTIGLSSTLANSDGTSYAHLDASRHAVILVRRSGRVAHLNKAARYLNITDPVLTINRSERLSTANEMLAGYIAAARQAISRNSPAELPRPRALSDPRHGHLIIHAHIFPTDADHDFPCIAWSDPIAGAFVITGTLGLDPDGDFAQIARSLGATPAEAQLAQAISNGSAINDYANEKSLSRHTVRNQMRALLHKTETRNQTEFVRKMLMLMSPFEGFEQ